LSLSYNGESRAICDDGFGTQSAAVACLELYNNPAVISVN
jgi:hypothetical protein